MEKKEYIIPEIGINEYNFSLLRSDESQNLPGGAGVPERKDPKF